LEKISVLEPNELTFITQIAVTDCMLVCESGGTRLKPQIICQTKSWFKLLCFTWQEGQVIAAFGQSPCISSNVVTH